MTWWHDDHWHPGHHALCVTGCNFYFRSIVNLADKLLSYAFQNGLVTLLMMTHEDMMTKWQEASQTTGSMVYLILYYFSSQAYPPPFLFRAHVPNSSAHCELDLTSKSSDKCILRSILSFTGFLISQDLTLSPKYFG